MTRHDDDQLASWMAIGPQSGPDGALTDALARAHAARQRPAWLVAATGGTIAAGRDNGMLRAMALAIAVVALVGALMGALVAGGILPPPFRPNPSALADVSAMPSASEPQQATLEPTPEATPAPPLGLVAYTAGDQLEPGQGDCTEDRADQHYCYVGRVWIMHTDGTELHALHPDAVTSEGFIAWTHDGSRILYQDAQGLALADPDGTVVQRWPYDLCPGGCSVELGGALSPDDARLVYVNQTDSGGLESSVLAILDLETGEVTELESTRSRMAVEPHLCHTTPGCEGTNDQPTWSPDGTRIVFARQTMSPEPGSTWNAAAIYVVNADGTGFRRVTPVGTYAVGPQWSPDGTRIAFMGIQQIISSDGLTVQQELSDLYTIRPNGQEIVQLTNDGVSFEPRWTLAGRVTYTRILVSDDREEYEPWIVDADGSDRTQLPESLAALNEAGCVICVHQVEGNEGATWISWQPRP
jgi:hypothetical protein